MKEADGCVFKSEDGRGSGSGAEHEGWQDGLTKGE